MVKESFPVFLSSSIAFSMTSLKESTRLHPLCPWHTNNSSKRLFAECR